MQTPASNRIDCLTETVLALLDRKERGTCQNPTCFEIAQMSETKTSLSFCSEHYFERVGRMNYAVIRGSERGI